MISIKRLNKIGLLKILPFWVKVDLRVMVMKEYSKTGAPPSDEL